MASCTSSTWTPIPEPLSKKRPFDHTVLSDSSIHKMDVILYKEFEGSAKKTGKLRGLFPHLLDLKRIQADRNTFLLEKARKIDQGDDDDDDDKSDDEESDDEEASTTDMILTIIETRSLMLKLWLRRIHLNRQENEEQNDKLVDLEHAVYQELEVIKQYQALVLEKRYNTYQELEALISSYEDLLEASTKKTMEEKDKVDFEINDDDIVRFRSDLVRICSVLGLRLDFLDRHAKISEDVRDHWTISDWLAIFLQENHGCLDLSEKVSLNRDLLVSIGFDPMGFAIEKILARAGPRKEHIEPSEWAKIFIEDELKYNPLLFDSERFPFRSDFTNQWFQAFEEDDIGVENLERPRQVNILNLVTNDSEIYRHQFELTNFPQQLKDDTHVVLFHGTDHKSGFDILSRGIYLYLGRQKRDFSNRNGFYLTDSFDDAIGWASSTTAKPCVIVFLLLKLKRFDCKKIAKCGMS